jgi:hypothetical protein
MKLWRKYSYRKMSGRIEGANRLVSNPAQPSKLLLALFKKAGI